MSIWKGLWSSAQHMNYQLVVRVFVLIDYAAAGLLWAHKLLHRCDMVKVYESQME